MLTKEHIINQISIHKEQIKSFGVNEIGLFGSYVRNEQTEKSDIDILVEFDKEKKSFDNFLNLCYLIDDIFKIKVEVITKKGLSEFLAPYILKEVEYVKI